jgi:hypothetical protein
MFNIQLKTKVKRYHSASDGQGKIFKGVTVKNKKIQEPFDKE